MERHPLKLSITRRSVHWPLPFSVLGFLMGLFLSAFFGFLAVEVSGLLSKLLIAFWGLIFSHATYGAYHNIREHLRWFGVHRRFPLGQCDYCGYSLRGNTTGVCPECGGKMSTGSRRYIARQEL